MWKHVIRVGLIVCIKKKNILNSFVKGDKDRISCKMFGNAFHNTHPWWKNGSVSPVKALKSE